MRFRSVIILFAAFALVSLVSCKKEEETKEYMNGNLSVKHEMPPYVKKGDKYSFTPSGVTAPDGTDVGYYFSAFGKTDTLKNGATSWVFEVPDTLGTFSISCAAYPIKSSDKYYNTSGYISFAVVSDDETNGSITNIGRHLGDTKVYIDGRLFYSFKAGGKDWLRGNLCTIRRDENGKEVFGRSYAGSPAMQNVFGAYYTWEEAQTACPSGWHLPTESEWIELLKEAGAPEGLKVLESSPCGAGKLMTKAYFNGALMWDYYRDVTISDQYLSAIPVGYCEIGGNQTLYLGYADYAVFWTADEYEGMGIYRYIYKDSDSVYAGTADKKDFGASVRCVK